MSKVAQDPYQHLRDLRGQLRQIVLTRSATPAAPRSPRKGMLGIYGQTSQYNPWRAYVWHPVTREKIHLGGFPTVAQCQSAQKAWREGRPITHGTKVAPYRRVIA